MTVLDVMNALDKDDYIDVYDAEVIKHLLDLKSHDCIDYDVIDGAWTNIELTKLGIKRMKALRLGKLSSISLSEAEYMEGQFKRFLIRSIPFFITTAMLISMGIYASIRVLLK